MATYKETGILTHVDEAGNEYELYPKASGLTNSLKISLGDATQVFDGSKEVNIDIENNVNADWNQNDETAADYVKNRTHWVGDPVETVILEETNITFEYSMAYVENIILTEGATYIVSFDGTSHEYVAVNSESSISIGNPDEEFDCVCSYYPYDGCTEIMLNSSKYDRNGTYSVSIIGLIPDIHTIDKKFLPVASTFEAGVISLSDIPKNIINEIRINIGETTRGELISANYLNGDENFKYIQLYYTDSSGHECIDFLYTLIPYSITGAGVEDGHYVCHIPVYKSLLTSHQKPDNNLYTLTLEYDAEKYSDLANSTIVGFKLKTTDSLTVSSSTADSDKTFAISVDDDKRISIVNTNDEEDIAEVALKSDLESPDWNQNDETAADYVKNRTHWVSDPIETVLMENQTVTLNKNGSNYLGLIQSDITLIDGASYVVTWNNVTYNCVPFFVDGMLALGNTSIIGGVDTGEPFVIAVNSGDHTMIVVGKAAGNNIISIVHIDAEIHKIDKKYLPIAEDYSRGILSLFEVKKALKTDAVSVLIGTTKYSDAAFAYYNNALPEYIAYDGDTYTCIDTTCFSNATKGMHFVGYTCVSSTGRVVDLLLIFSDDSDDALLESVEVRESYALKSDLENPDWNQNDETAADYVKNRTHWKEQGLEVIVDETSETSTTLGGSSIAYSLNEGQLYVVTVDNIKYRCICYLSSNSTTCLGDSRLMITWTDNGEAPDTSNPEDVPFLVEYEMSDDGSGTNWVFYHNFYFYYPDSNTHTIKIEKETDEVVYHQLDERFIPETIARKSDLENIDLSLYETTENAQTKYDELTAAKADVEHTHSWNDLKDRPFYTEGGGSVEILPETQATDIGEGSFAVTENVPNLVIGETYTVKYNGAVYECVAQDASALIPGGVGIGNGTSLGLSGNNEPFAAAIGEENGQLVMMILPLDGATEVTISISQGGGGMTEILPECQPVYSEADDGFVFEAAVTLEGDQTVTVNWNGTEYECQTYWFSMDAENDSVVLGNSEFLTSVGITVESNELPFVILAMPNASVYMFIPIDGSTEITVSIYQGGETIHYLDPKYIKDMYYTEQKPAESLSETTYESVSSPIQLRTALSITAGANYTVMWNGAPYECVATETSSGDHTYKYMGNGYLGRMYLGANAEDTGEPFFILTALSANEDATIIIFNDGSTTVTLSYEGVVNIIHKIDAKYLPEMPNTSVTYTLTKSGSTITLTGSDGSETSVEDSDTTYTLRSFGVTATSTEINYVDGVTAPIQTQLNEKPGKITDTYNYSEIFNDYNNNIASGYFSHAEGWKTTASGESSHAEGYITTASSSCSHAEGNRTTASGSCSHAEGYHTTASGDSSHAEGSYTTASGEWSHAEGYCTIASKRFQHVQGKYNVEDTENKYAHIVGNGESDTDRSNAHTLDWDGNAWYAGTIKVGGTSYDDASEVATKEWVKELIGGIENGTY